MGPAQNPGERADFAAMMRGWKRERLAWPRILLLAFLLSSCGRNDGEPVLGFVFQVEGTAAFNPIAQPDRSRPLFTGGQFSAREEKHLLTESSAALCLTPGIYLRGFGPAGMEVEDLRVSKDGDETGNSMKMRRAVVRLGEGRFHFFLPRAGSARAD